MSQILERLKNLQNNTQLKKPKAVFLKFYNSKGFKSKYSKGLMIAFVSLIGFTGMVKSGVALYGYFKTEPKKVQVVERLPIEIKRAENTKALNLFKSSKYLKAIGVWEKLVKKYPNLTDAYANIGIAYKKINDLDSARTNLERAVKLGPKNGPAYNNLAMVYFAQKRYKLSEESFKKAITHWPEGAEPILNLSTFYEKLKRYGLAIEYYKKYNTHPNANPSVVGKVKIRMPRLHSILVRHEHRRGRY